MLRTNRRGNSSASAWATALAWVILLQTSTSNESVQCKKSKIYKFLKVQLNNFVFSLC